MIELMRMGKWWVGDVWGQRYALGRRWGIVGCRMWLIMGAGKWWLLFLIGDKRLMIRHLVYTSSRCVFECMCGDVRVYVWRCLSVFWWLCKRMYGDVQVYVWRCLSVFWWVCKRMCGDV